MRVCIVALVCLLGSVAAQAHQMKAAITKVLFNARTGNIEVMHRFYVHDAEHALAKQTGGQVQLLGNTQSQADFGHYVGEHFALAYQKGQPLALSYVGQEVDGKFIWVYQETAIGSQRPDSLWFRHDALQDIWPEQVNQVNVEGLGRVRALQFEHGSGWQVIHLTD